MGAPPPASGSSRHDAGAAPVFHPLSNCTAMAILWCRLLDDSADVGDRQFSYSAVYEVKSDSRTDTGRAILNGAVSAAPDPIPVHMASYSLNGSSDPSAFAQTYKARRRRSVDESGCLWRIDVDWFAKDGDPDDDSTSEDNPLLRPVRINIECEEIQEIVEVGWNEEALTGLGRDADEFGPIVNSAGKEPGSSLMEGKRCPVLIFRRNVANLAAGVSLMLSYDNRINDAPFYGAPAGKALVRQITLSDEQTEGGVKFREVEIRVAIYDKGWTYPMVNRGYEYIDLWSSELTRIEATVFDKESRRWRPVAEPINLTLAGLPTPAGAMGSVTHWRTREKADFSGLGVGT
jgi:hypothetical protein